MKPKWQRARILEGRGGAFNLDGGILWVECAPPEQATGETADGMSVQSYEAYWTNLQSNDGVQVGVPSEAVELLPDFADDVPFIPWEQFLAECRAKPSSPA